MVYWLRERLLSAALRSLPLLSPRRRKEPHHLFGTEPVHWSIFQHLEQEELEIKDLFGGEPLAGRIGDQILHSLVKRSLIAWCMLVLEETRDVVAKIIHFSDDGRLPFICSLGRSCARVEMP
jgi:hypothetical protein